MKKCMLAACSAVGILLCTGGCGSRCSDTVTSDVAALRGEVDQLKTEVARLKARVAAIGPRSEMAPAAGPRPNVETVRPHKMDRKRIEEMRRRHEEHMRLRREDKSNAGAGEAAPASVAEPAQQQKAD